MHFLVYIVVIAISIFNRSENYIFCQIRYMYTHLGLVCLCDGDVKKSMTPAWVIVFVDESIALILNC